MEDKPPALALGGEASKQRIEEIARHARRPPRIARTWTYSGGNGCEQFLESIARMYFDT